VGAVLSEPVPADLAAVSLFGRENTGKFLGFGTISPDGAVVRSQNLRGFLPNSLIRGTGNLMHGTGKQKLLLWKANTVRRAESKSRKVTTRSHQSSWEFASIHFSILNHFNQERHLYNRQTFNLNRAAALAEWSELAI